MRGTKTDQDPYNKGYPSTITRWKILIMGHMLLLVVLMSNTRVEATPFKTASTDDPTVIINCSKAVKTTAPKFSSRGSAKYPFSMKYTSRERAGLMLSTWEGRWNPSETRQAQPENQDQQDLSAEVTSFSVPSDGEAMGGEPVFSQVAITFDQPLHFMAANGDNTLIAAGVYEIEPVLDLQLSLAREGQAAMLVPAIQRTHSEAIQQPMALVIPGQSKDEQHLVLLMPDGKRFDSVGSISGVKSRSIRMVATFPDKFLKDAIIQSSAQPASEPPPPCQQNPEPSGPRWLPVPCTMLSIPL